MEKEAKAMMLIDTNIFIDHLRGHQPATKFLAQLVGRDDVLFSAITETELTAGAINNDHKKREMVLHLLHQWTKVSLGNPVAAFAGDIQRQYGLETPDAIIAATARSTGAELLTRNIKDFQRVPELRVRTPY
jgi:hypothetical protein